MFSSQVKAPLGSKVSVLPGGSRNGGFCCSSILSLLIFSLSRVGAPVLCNAAQCMDFQASSYWAIIGSKERRAALAEHCIRAKSSSWESTLDASTCLSLCITGRHCVMETQAVFQRGTALTTFPGDSQLSLILNNPCVVSHSLQRTVQSWVTQRLKDLCIFGPWPNSSKRGEAAAVGNIDLGIDWFLPKARAGQDPSFLCQVLLGTPGEALKSL